MAHTDKDNICVCEDARSWCPHCRTLGTNAAHRKACHEREGKIHRRGRWPKRGWWVNKVINRPARYKAKQAIREGREPDPHRHKMHTSWD